jgi:hypothetical protein
MITKIRVAVCVLCILAASLFTGCLGAKTPPVARPAPPSIFVEYHRTGGSAALDDRLVIFDNGVTVISTKKDNYEIVLNQTDLDRIAALFSESQFSMLEHNYTARRTSPDFRKYTISYHSKTVNTEDSAVPHRIQPVIDELNRIVTMGTKADQHINPFAHIPS